TCHLRGNSLAYPSCKLFGQHHIGLLIDIDHVLDRLGVERLALREQPREKVSQAAQRRRRGGTGALRQHVEPGRHVRPPRSPPPSRRIQPPASTSTHRGRWSAPSGVTASTLASAGRCRAACTKPTKSFGRHHASTVEINTRSPARRRVTSKKLSSEERVVLTI